MTPLLPTVPQPSPSVTGKRCHTRGGLISPRGGTLFRATTRPHNQATRSPFQRLGSQRAAARAGRLRDPGPRFRARIWLGPARRGVSRLPPTEFNTLEPTTRHIGQAPQDNEKGARVTAGSVSAHLANTRWRGARAGGTPQSRFGNLSPARGDKRRRPSHPGRAPGRRTRASNSRPIFPVRHAAARDNPCVGAERGSAPGAECSRARPGREASGQPCGVTSSSHRFRQHKSEKPRLGYRRGSTNSEGLAYSLT